MYPFERLPDNLAAFCGELRRERGFRVGPGELRDAARALEVVNLFNEDAVRHALRPVLSATRDDAQVFDRAFTEFFFPGPRGVRQSDRMPPLDARDEAADEGDGHAASGTGPAGMGADETGGDADGTGAAAETEDQETGAPSLLLRSSYSPLAASGVEAPLVVRAGPEWRESARLFVRRMHLGLSRRWKPAPRGRRFDLRRTLRASLQTGGEALSPRWLRRPRRTPRFVLLIDGSRSMEGAAETALRIAVALASVTRRVDVFVFSTSLARVTTDVHRAAAGRTVPLSCRPHAWGGGTNIGACLRDFERRFGDRLLGRDTVVLIASDGLDVGDPGALRDAMRAIRRRSAAIVWLNPLLDTPGYEPTARGMQAARPFITTFACVRDAAGLARLSRLVSVRARIS